jgi:hypothetical protein
MTEAKIADGDSGEEWFATHFAEIADGASPGKASGTTERLSDVGDACLSMRSAGGQATGGQDASGVSNRFSNVGGAPVSASSSMVPSGGQSSDGQAASNGGASALTPEQMASIEANKGVAVAKRKARLVRDAEVANANVAAKANVSAVDDLFWRQAVMAAQLAEDTRIIRICLQPYTFHRPEVCSLPRRSQARTTVHFIFYAYMV